MLVHDVHDVHYQLVHAVAGKAEQARKLLLRLKAESERQRTGQLFFLPIAQVYAALGEKEQAFGWLEKDFQIRNSPDPAAAHLRLGLVLEKENRREDARKELQTAVGLDPNFKEAQDLKRLK